MSWLCKGSYRCEHVYYSLIIWDGKRFQTAGVWIHDYKVLNLYLADDEWVNGVLLPVNEYEVISSSYEYICAS